MRTVKLVIGILSCFLVIIVMFQSCAAGVVTSVEDKGDLSGSVGIIFAILLFSAGITAIAGRNSKGGTIGAGVIYAIGAAIGLTSSGVYADLQIWGGVSGVFAVVFLLSLISMRNSPKPAPAAYTPPTVGYSQPEPSPAPETPASVDHYDYSPQSSDPIQYSDAQFMASPICALSPKSHWVVQCLRIVSKTLIILIEVAGICCCYFFLTPVLMHYLTLEASLCAVLSIAIGVLGSAIVGVVLCLPLMGIALIIDDLHALRLYAVGYTISGKR